MFDDLIPSGEGTPPDRGGGSPYGGAISSIESGGRYDLLGPVTRTGDRAHGRYQVMGENIGPWSAEVFGVPLTREQFLQSPQAQDAVFQHKFGQYAQKYGPEGAARAWFAGEGGMNDMGRRDQLGTSVGEYSRRFTAALPQDAMAFAAPAGGSPARGAPAAGSSPGPAAGAISFDDLIPEGGRFADPPAGGNFRTAREGVSERYQPMGRVEAFSRAGQQGASFNFGDEIAGLRAAAQPGDTLEQAYARSGYPLWSFQGAGDVARGAFNLLTGDEKAASLRDRTLALERAANEKGERDQPGASLAGGLAGAIATPLPIRAPAAGASLATRMGQGLRTGALYGAIGGVGGGEDAEGRVIGGAVGGGLGSLVGGAAPAAVRGIQAAGAGLRAAASPITNTIRAIRDPEAEGARRITAGITRDAQAGAAGMTPAEFAAARAEGQPVTLMELGGETTRALARSAANTSPEARGDLTRSLEGRFGTQGDHIIGWLNRTFHYPNAQAQQAAMDQVEATVNRAAYRRAHLASDAANPGGVWSPELERLTSAPAVVEAMQEAAARGGNRAVSEGAGGFNPGVTFNGGVMQFRRGPTGAPTYPNLQFWDLTQRNLRQAADVAAARGRNEEAGALNALHRQLLTQLDAAVPEFQAARAGAARFFGAENALEAGQNFVNSRMGNREARVALARMSPEERRLFQDGFVSRYVQSLAEIPDRRNVLNQVANSGAARERLEIALGRDRARELEAMLRVEGIMQTANEAVRGNSTTARQLAEIGLAGGVGGYGYLSSDPNAMINTALVYGAARGQRAIDSRVARQVGRMLTSNDPAVLQRGLRIVGRQGRFLDSLRATDQALARAGAGQASAAGPAMIPQAAGVGRADQDEQ